MPFDCFATSHAACTCNRLYQALMAQHVLCPQQKSEQQCHTETSAYCAWNYQKQRCDTDSYASYLLTLSCPGSKARAYLQCMRKANAAECKADKACTAEHAGSCYPRSMVAAAQMAKVSMQAAAEETAFAIVTGRWPKSSVHADAHASHQHYTLLLEAAVW